MRKRKKNPAELVLMSANPAELVLMGANPGRTPRNKKSRRNPGSDSDLEAGSAMYEEFHGEGSKFVDEIQEPSPRPVTLADLGMLLELRVKRSGGWKWGSIDFTGRGIRLASNVEGSQLYFVDGDQKLSKGDLTELGVDHSKELIDLGEATLIAYRAKKAHIHNIMANYEHNFGEETGVRPRLGYDTRGPAPRLFLSGGEYRVEAAGIAN